MDYTKLAQTILNACGGIENIASCTHCVTRLRVVLVDQDRYDDAAVKETEAIKGHILNGAEKSVCFGCKDSKCRI